MINPGKRFEHNFVQSFDDTYAIIRLNDCGGRGNATNIRFTPNNPCDYIVYKKPYIYLLELKTTKGKSLPLANIKPNQLAASEHYAKYKGVFFYFIVNFRDIEETYMVSYNNIKDGTKERASLSAEYCRLHCKSIVGIKKRTNFSYDVNSAF